MPELLSYSAWTRRHHLRGYGCSPRTWPRTAGVGTIPTPAHRGIGLLFLRESSAHRTQGAGEEARLRPSQPQLTSRNTRSACPHVPRADGTDEGRTNVERTDQPPRPPTPCTHPRTPPGCLRRRRGALGHSFFVSPSKVRQFPPQIPGVDLDAAALVTRPGTLPEGSEAHLTWALITLMTRRLTRGSGRRRRTVFTSPERRFNPALYNRVECHVR